MTGLDRPVTRETSTIDGTRGGRRYLIVRLEEGGRVLKIRPKGTRRWFALDYNTIYQQAIRAYARDLAARKKEEREAKRKEKRR